MSDQILRALMQLFAIIAKIDEVSEKNGQTIEIQSTKSKEIISGFLKSELSSSDVAKYISIFNEFLIATRETLVSKNKDHKRTTLHSVKVLRICSQINKELTQRQKIIVLIRIFEFIDRDDYRSEKEMSFVKIVSESFHVPNDEYELLRDFVEQGGENIIDQENHIYYSGTPIRSLKKAKSGISEGLDSLVHIIQVRSVRTLFFKYVGEQELYVNGQIVATDKTHIFNIGSTLKTAKSSQIFYSDLITKLNSSGVIIPMSFEAKNIIHTFKGGETAIRNVSAVTETAKMIGIMGGSGSGKTSLLNIMNGKIKPTFGTIEINGINLHDEKSKLEGVIGNVNQNDLLIEELTVFQNLYFSAKLSLKGIPKNVMTKKVIRLLQSIGLYEIRGLKVGSSVEKIISGGQRKRLNIALELIREPSVLFVDEPTSGLSSKDSDNIMDLLKELSLKGKLVFVVIHQPSSNIFKLFDRLLILDQGGYPIYDGIPLNAVVYFKTLSFQGNAHERECNLCGNVNPEQIFNIIDAKIIDEFGLETGTRKKSPEDWHKLYKKHKHEYDIETVQGPPSSRVHLPSAFSQFITYITRDVLSKKSNRQYMLINGLVAPILALILSFFIKYSGWINGIETYSYYQNENIPQYIFIAVIVSIFLGLTVSAEEINKDKKILAREEFLNLSRTSYLLSKVIILFAISALQASLFVIIGNSIMEINGMWFEYWMILFSTACLSNLMGLNISSAFNSAKVIYIIIPLFIIPQLLFSGVIVKFDKLHPSLSNATKVPWIGNLMVARWAYEGLTVEQASQNDLEACFLGYKISKSQSEWKKDYWIPEMKRQINILLDKDVSKNNEALAIKILSNEITKEESHLKNLNCINCIEDLASKPMNTIESFKEMEGFLYKIHLHCVKTINDNSDLIHSAIDSIGIKNFKKQQALYDNEALNKIVTNRAETNKLIIVNNEIYQNDTPIYNIDNKSSFFDTHYYAPYKSLFGSSLKTFTANLIIIWIISLLTYIVLYFDILKKLIDGILRGFEFLKIQRKPKGA